MVLRTGRPQAEGKPRGNRQEYASHCKVTLEIFAPNLNPIICTMKNQRTKISVDKMLNKKLTILATRLGVKKTDLLRAFASVHASDIKKFFKKYAKDTRPTKLQD